MGPNPYQLLRDASFDPDEMGRMILAYEAALELLRQTDHPEPVAEVIARKIIEISRRGITDPPRICATALTELGVPPP